MRNLNASRGRDAMAVGVQRVAEADHEMDHILDDPELSSRNKIFALATAHERLDNSTRPFRSFQTRPAPSPMTPPPVLALPAATPLVSNLERRADIITSTVGKSQIHNAEKLVKYLRDIGMDINESMEPTVDDTVLTGANISDLVHWITNPINQRFQPRHLESFMRILSQHFMPATMITNKDRRLMYTSLSDANSSGLHASTGLVRKPSEVPGLWSLQDNLISSPNNLSLNGISRQTGNGFKWSFY